MKTLIAGLAVVVGATYALSVAAQETKVAIGISGWTGFAPLTLAKEAGIFKKHGIDATIKKFRKRIAISYRSATYGTQRPL
jgi:NitT/TauT family transport system substrate-binding protein